MSFQGCPTQCQPLAAAVTYNLPTWMLMTSPHGYNFLPVVPPHRPQNDLAPWTSIVLYLFIYFGFSYVISVDTIRACICNSFNHTVA